MKARLKDVWDCLCMTVAAQAIAGIVVASAVVLAMLVSTPPTPDYADALPEWRLMAEQGNARAQYNLGAMYFTGRGVPKDNVLAYHWFTLAAAQGNDAARRANALAQHKMTAEQIAEAQKLSDEFKPTQ